MAQRRKIIAWGVGLGLLLGVAGVSRSEDPEKTTNVTIDADHEPLLVVIKRICVSQGLGFVANDAALEKAGKVSLSLHEVSLETALDVICEAYALEARVRNHILIVRPRGMDTTAAVPAPEPAKRNRFMPEEPRDNVPAPTPVERARPATPSPIETAPITTVVIHSGASGPTTGGGHMTSGTIVEITKDSVRVKEAAGDPRDYAIAQGDDEGARSSKLGQALRRLKVGDRIAIEYRVVEGHAFITNLVGGGNPQPKP